MKPVANAALSYSNAPLESGDLHVYWYIRRTINPTFTYQLKELVYKLESTNKEETCSQMT